MRSALLPAFGAGLALALASAAHAQTPGPHWDGSYAGLVAGVQWTSARFALPNDPADVLLSDQRTRSHGFGGVLAGFNRQSGDVVFGLEGDLEGGHRTLEATSCNVVDGCWSPAGDSFTTHNRLKEDLTGHVRLRAGIARGANLFYAAAGYAYARTRLDLVGDCFDPANPTVPTVYTFSRKKSLSGYSLGAGVEHRAGEHLVLRAEYLFDGFGHKTFAGDGGFWNDRRIRLRHSDLRLAASWRF
jgi:opacity protein-like surface antigen